MQAALQIVAWSGASVFAASLIWFLYLYIFRFDAAPPSVSATSAVAVDVLLFSVFAFHHSLFARTGTKQWLERRVHPALERSLYTWIASLLFIAVCTWWRPVPGTLYDLDGLWSLTAYAVQAAGVVLTVRASRALDALDLAGVRPVLNAAAQLPPRHVPLETRGLYAFVRHPLYFAWALFVFATPTMTGTRAVFAVVSTAYLALAIPWEERALVTTFGDSYTAYRRKVRWKMVPGIY